MCRSIYPTHLEQMHILDDQESDLATLILLLEQFATCTILNVSDHKLLMCDGYNFQRASYINAL